MDVYLGSLRVVDELQKRSSARIDSQEVQRTRLVVDVVQSGAADNSDPLASFQVDLYGEHPSDPVEFSKRTGIILYADTLGSILLAQKNNIRVDAEDSTKAEFFVANGMSKTIDVALFGAAGKTSQLLIDDLEPGRSSPYVALEPGLHTLAMTSQDGSGQLGAFRFDSSQSAGQAINVITVDGPGGSLVAVAVDGEGVFTDPAIVTSAEDELPLPAQLSIVDVFVNPFAERTEIRYTLPDQKEVLLTVFGMQGRRVQTLVSSVRPPGHHVVVWNGRADGGSVAASGTCFIRLEVDGSVKTRSVVLSR